MYNFKIPRQIKFNSTSSSDTSSEDNSSNNDANRHMNPQMADMTKLLEMYDKKVYRKYNHLYFRTDVSMSNITKLCNLIDDYNHEQEIINSSLKTSIVVPKPLYLHITSMGGDLLAGFMAYDYIKNSNIPIYTVAEGYTVSAGSIMFMAGERRLMTENSYLLIHQLNQTSFGRETFHDMMDNATNTIEFMSRLYSIYLNNLRYNRKKVNKEDVLTKEKLENHLLHDIYWNINTCIRYGLVDDVYTNYNTVDTNDIKEFVNQEKLTNTYTPPKKITLKDLQPSEKFVEQLQHNMEDQSNVINIVKQFLAKKQTMSNSTLEEDDEEDSKATAIVSKGSTKKRTRQSVARKVKRKKV